MRRLYYQTDSAELACQVARQLHSIRSCGRWRFQAFTRDEYGHYCQLLRAHSAETEDIIGLLDRWLAWLYLLLQTQRQTGSASDSDQQQIVLIVFVPKQDERQVRNVMSHLPICAMDSTTRRGFRDVLGKRVAQA